MLGRIRASAASAFPALRRWCICRNPTTRRGLEIGFGLSVVDGVGGDDGMALLRREAIGLQQCLQHAERWYEPSEELHIPEVA